VLLERITTKDQEPDMKKNTEDQKRLKLDIETLRRLQLDEIDRAVGGQGQPAELGCVSLFNCVCTTYCP
jgi:hypothetical protein